jgi:hypothetical protein
MDEEKHDSGFKFFALTGSEARPRVAWRSGSELDSSG